MVTVVGLAASPIVTALWRKMVCPPEDRPGQWGYWENRSTDGFGYHEFLQFCEDIGADAMYVAFCGMTVHPENNMPLDQIGPVIQRTLDAIEYANGPTTSTWGALRAKHGHPKPFKLKYLEIGNENGGPAYRERCQQWLGQLWADKDALITRLRAQPSPTS